MGQGTELPPLPGEQSGRGRRLLKFCAGLFAVLTLDK